MNEPWFVAKDVCDVLEISNTTDVIKRLEEDEVTRFNLGGLFSEVNVINEYGLYSIIMGSRKKEAKDFKKWITHEVIPSIRKPGG
ncbi:BRO-N domain-containing protein [Paenibacillus sp. FSL R7-277]|uniref:BRO-N domain-containing protein n=1 Tax=Paenibacillus sp. FSL R7-277 TaxID=1227352 RepID=UPI0009DCA210|nr:Bro-N domain-containing protein [Paenibacillus sp. FSL R7-277]